jgi:hypothetical protein
MLGAIATAFFVLARLNAKSNERFRERAKNQRSRRVYTLAQAEAYAT